MLNIWNFGLLCPHEHQAFPDRSFSLLLTNDYLAEFCNLLIINNNKDLAALLSCSLFITNLHENVQCSLKQEILVMKVFRNICV